MATKTQLKPKVLTESQLGLPNFPTQARLYQEKLNEVILHQFEEGYKYSASFQKTILNQVQNYLVFYPIN